MTDYVEFMADLVCLRCGQRWQEECAYSSKEHGGGWDSCDLGEPGDLKCSHCGWEPQQGTIWDMEDIELEKYRARVAMAAVPPLDNLLSPEGLRWVS